MVMSTRLLPAAALLLLCTGATAEHPCEAEVASACADRPGTDVGACLKDPEEHDNPTEISSACTDFIALNKACTDDIEEYCEAAHFADDTIPCLTQRTPIEDLSEKCQGVISWAVPDEVKEASEEQVVTDELGMSEQDYAEKKEWQEKRKAARGEAMERMKNITAMKEVDRKKEEDRVALEEFKKNDPEGYEAMLQQQAEEKRQKEEFKRKERARAAALERAKRKAAGQSDDDDEDESSKTSTGPKKKGTKAKDKGSWLYTILSFLVLAAVFGGGWVLLSKKGGGGGSNKKSKKKRG